MVRWDQVGTSFSKRALPIWASVSLSVHMDLSTPPSFYGAVRIRIAYEPTFKSEQHLATGSIALVLMMRSSRYDRYE